MPRSTAFFLTAVAVLAGAALPPADAQAPPTGLRLVSREGSRTLSTVTVNNQEYVALDELASTFGLTLREDRLAGGVTLASGPRSVIITADQAVASVSGRLVSLAAAPIRQGNRWLVPLDFLQRALGPTLETRMELRRASRLLVIGDVRVPRVTTRVEATAGGASVVFDVSPATPARVTSEGGQLTVNFEADALDLQVAPTASPDFVQSVQPGPSPASVRVVPGPKYGVHRATTAQPDAGSSRLTLDMLPAGAEPAAPPATPPPVPPSSAPTDPLPAPVPAAGLRTVVIDPGHGGNEPGARGAGGTLEKDVTLQVARRLRTMIESRLGLRVFLTRDDDRTMTLDNRAAYANSQKADVFISIHANAALRPAMAGAEVYYLSAEPGADTRPAPSAETLLPALGGGTRSIDLVPWESAQARSLGQSSTLAGLVEQSLRERVEMSPRAVQQAPFRVLVGATMPAVLVEMGYLSNTEQEQALASGTYQDQIAQALFDAIVRFRGHVER